MAGSYEQELLGRSMGEFGGVRFNGEGHATGNFCGIHALTDTTVKATTIGNIDNIVGAVIPKGDTVVGYFTIVHASGDHIIYNAKAE
jgi:hypothetical protein